MGHELRTYNLENGRMSVIVGNQNKESSYREGPGTTVYFEQITGFAQTSNDFVVVVSTWEHCLRSVTRQNATTKVFAGECKSGGFSNGKWDYAHFNRPFKIIQDAKNHTTLFVTDGSNIQVRTVNTYTRTVGSLVTMGNSTEDEPYGIAQDKSSGDLYITTRHKVYRYVYESSGELQLVSGTTSGFLDNSLLQAMYKGMREIIFLSNTTLLVADWGNNRLRQLDLTYERTSSFCDGTRQSTDGDLRTCQLKDVHSVVFERGSVYVGESDGIRVVNLSSSMAVEGNTTSAANSLPIPLHPLGTDSSTNATISQGEGAINLCIEFVLTLI